MTSSLLTVRASVRLRSVRNVETDRLWSESSLMRDRVAKALQIALSKCLTSGVEDAETGTLLANFSAVAKRFDIVDDVLERLAVVPCIEGFLNGFLHGEGVLGRIAAF